MKKWIWQHQEYPHFKYDKESLVDLIAQIEYNHGVLNGIAKAINSEDVKNIELDILINEAINTSAIEGEYLKRDSVRASLYKKLSFEFDEFNDSSTYQTDALASLLLDCNSNKSSLTLERLHGWHNSLFVSGYSGLHKIRVATFRDHDDMEVVSGSIGHERVHYLAPPKELIKKDVDNLLRWIDKFDENIYIKSALAHLWFVSIHPYDDGNGRIARAITDYILSSPEDIETKFKLYSISTAINKERKAYYDILDKSTNLLLNIEFDFTPWLKWHLNIVKLSMIDAQKQIEYLIQKTKFWDKHREDNLNSRQVKVLNKILDIGSDNFQGGISTKKYISITKISKATAVRDIQELVEKGCIKQIDGTGGRSVRYEII